MEIPLTDLPCKPENNILGNYLCNLTFLGETELQVIFALLKPCWLIVLVCSLFIMDPKDSKILPKAASIRLIYSQKKSKKWDSKCFLDKNLIPSQFKTLMLKRLLKFVRLTIKMFKRIKMESL